MNSRRVIFVLLIFLIFLGCHHHPSPPTVKLDGVNMGWDWTAGDVEEVIQHNARIIRVPVRRENRTQIFKAVDRFIKAGVMPVIVFDGANSETEYEQEIHAYMERYGARICYEVLNEPLAMGNPFGLKTPEQVLAFMNKYIDYIHNHIGRTSVLSCGIANVFAGPELDLMKLVIAKGHQDILSVHVYACEDTETFASEILKWHGPIWITEIGTTGDKVTFCNVCLPRTQRIRPAQTIWFDLKSKLFGITRSPLWQKIF